MSSEEITVNPDLPGVLRLVQSKLESDQLVTRADAMDMAGALTAIRRALAKQHYRGPTADKNFDWLESNWTAQSTQFAIDLLPVVHRLMLRTWKRQDTVKLLDFGAGSGAGANVWSSLHRGDAVWSRMVVDAADVNAGRELFAKLYFPSVNYIVGDAFGLGRTWDIVVCSHVVEHVREPAPFIRRVVQLAKRFAVFYAPYDERERIPGHLNTITEELFQPFSPLEIQIVKSMGWRAARPEEKCIIAVLAGEAGDLSANTETR